MSPTELAEAATLAGRGHNLRCTYEYDRRAGQFVWRFYRNRTTIVGTIKVPSRVMTKLAALCKTEREGERKCPNCGTAFVRPRTGPGMKRLYCSEKCKRQVNSREQTQRKNLLTSPSTGFTMV